MRVARTAGPPISSAMPISARQVATMLTETPTKYVVGSADGKASMVRLPTTNEVVMRQSQTREAFWARPRLVHGAGRARPSSDRN